MHQQIITSDSSVFQMYLSVQILGIKYLHTYI